VAPEASKALRRRPAQERSRQRVERMLDACAELLDDVGYDALTTREVARRAGVPIGTLYQFFADRQGLCRALAERNLEQFSERLRRRFAQEAVGRWADTASIVVEEYVAMKREVPGFTAVDFGEPHPRRPHLRREVSENNDLVSERMLTLGLEVGLPPSEAAGHHLRVAVEVADCVLRLAFRDGPPGDDACIAEAAWLLRCYFSDRLDAAGGAAPSGRPAPATSLRTATTGTVTTGTVTTGTATTGTAAKRAVRRPAAAVRR
jgi:AcrR family transcriptional regulator